MQRTEVLGIDIGGSGIKAAIVDVNSGNWRVKNSEWFTAKMLEKKEYAKKKLWYKIKTKNKTGNKPTPIEMRAIFEDIIDYFDWSGSVGVGFPAIIQDGFVKSASNIHQDWLSLNKSLPEFLSSNLTNIQVSAFNDADAAGMGEIALRSKEENKGSVLVLTVGTGIGSALFIDGKLVPNTEFGHFFIKIDAKKYKKECELAEDFAADSVRENLELKWKTWALERLKEYLRCIQRLLSPKCIIIGGGAGRKKRFDQYKDYLIDSDTDFATYLKRHKTDGRAKIETEITHAQLENYAGIVGAATLAHQQ